MFESERLYYREMIQDDINDFYEIFNSDNVDKFVKKMSYEQVEKYFEKRKDKAPNPYSFAVILKESNKMIGTIGVKEKEPHIGNLSYVFNDKYWGKEYASESVAFILENALNNWGFQEIKADCQFDNVASNKILKKFGFKYLYSNENNVSHLTNKNIKFNFYVLKKC